MPSQWVADVKRKAAVPDISKPVRMTAWRRREVADNWRRFMSSGFAGYTTVETPDAG